MLSRLGNFLSIIVLISASGVAVLAQGVDASNKTINPEKENQPKNVRELFEKMRIDRDKKDFDAMIKRGEDVLKIAEVIDKSFTENGRFTAEDLDRFNSIEQDAKKIRSELGGKDDDEEWILDNRTDRTQLLAEAFKAFRVTAENLVCELKKTTRFSISASAIAATNTVIKLARFLRIGKN